MLLKILHYLYLKKHNLANDKDFDQYQLMMANFYIQNYVDDSFSI